MVSIEQAVAAPLCTVRLADAGARVIKVERPDGETARHYDASVEGVSAYFVWLNRGKESTALDLKSVEDLASIEAIADRHRLSEKTVRSTLSLALLAPDIVDAAIDAKLPKRLTTTQMMDLSADWREQHKVLGLA